MLNTQTPIQENKLNFPTRPCPLSRCMQAGYVLVVVISCISAGCSDGRPERVAVSGQVLIDGKPLTVGNIKFVPKGARPSAGKIDENGRFTLTCYDGNDGVVPGEHQVQVSASKILSDTLIHWYAPKQYASFRTSGLKQEITESTDSLVIELTWGKNKPKKGDYVAEK